MRVDVDAQRARGPGPCVDLEQKIMRRSPLADGGRDRLCDGRRLDEQRREGDIRLRARVSDAEQVDGPPGRPDHAAGRIDEEDGRTGGIEGRPEFRVLEPVQGAMADQARHEPGGGTQEAEVFRREPARHMVDRAERAEGQTGLGGERHAGIGTDMRLARDQRIVGEARIGGGVLDHERRAFEHDMAAERDVARSLGRVQPVSRLEPLAIPVDQRNEADRHAQPRGDERGDVVERGVGRRFEQTALVQGALPRLLVRRCVRALHGCGPPAQSLVSSFARPRPLGFPGTKSRLETAPSAIRKLRRGSRRNLRIAAQRGARADGAETTHARCARLLEIDSRPQRVRRNRPARKDLPCRIPFSRTFACLTGRRRRSRSPAGVSRRSARHPRPDPAIRASTAAARSRSPGWSRRTRISTRRCWAWAGTATRSGPG
jgi:hypothetical protein